MALTPTLYIFFHISKYKMGNLFFRGSLIVIKSVEIFFTSKYSVISEKYLKISYKTEALTPPIYIK